MTVSWRALDLDAIWQRSLVEIMEHAERTPLVVGMPDEFDAHPLWADGVEGPVGDHEHLQELVGARLLASTNGERSWTLTESGRTWLKQQRAARDVGEEWPWRTIYRE